MQSFLSQAMEAAEDPGDHPSSTYPNIEHAQYDNTQYGFAQDSHPFPIDQSLDMSANFVSTDGKTMDEDIGGHHMSLSGRNGHGGAIGSHSGSAHTSTSLTTATQPHTPLNPSTKRKSLEDPSENPPVGGDSRRKRSKVSRACDQCRKKKIRCDSDNGDGTLKTCSNCLKSGQTCDYNRIPQKRGPSKGYIKDLSERVHHLEDSLAQSATYRSSIDAANYGDPPFSPEEDSAVRRQASISQQRNPFADFTRDRFPSVGGWTNSAQVSNLPRDRGSIAVSPDQLGPPQLFSRRASKPWWSPVNLPPEKAKTPTEAEETARLLDTIEMEHYYGIIHPQCPVLPHTAKARSVLEKSSKEYLEAFKSAMDLVPRSPKRTLHLGQDQKERLENFVMSKSQEPWADRTDVDNLVLLWCTVLLQIALLHSMKDYRKNNSLVHVGLGLVAGFVKVKDFLPDLQHEAEWIGSFHIVAIFARLDALSQGNSTDPLPSYLTVYLNTDWQFVAPRARFGVMMTDMLQVALSTLPKDGASVTLESSENYGRLQSSNIRAWLSASGLKAEDPFVKEIEALATLLSLRFTSPMTKPAIFEPVSNLVETIRICSLQQNPSQYLFNPFTFHTNAVAMTALLEIQLCSFENQQDQNLVEKALSDLMKQLIEFSDQRKRASEGNYGGLFWAKALVHLAEDKLKQNSRARPTSEDRSEDEVVPELARILHRGYIYPVLDMITD